MPRKIVSIQERLDALSMPEPNSGCILWIGSVSRGGYGLMKMPGRLTRLAHRVSYAEAIGPIPDGLDLDHLCRVRCCINPHHLEPVSKAENNRRGVSPAALNAVKTHCKRGHPLSGENLYVTPGGKRQCRECGRPYDRKCGPHISARGERNASAKLTDEAVAAILADRRSGVTLAKEYGVSEATISRVRRGNLWGHVAGARRKTRSGRAARVYVVCA